MALLPCENVPFVGTSCIHATVNALLFLSFAAAFICCLFLLPSSAAFFCLLLLPPTRRYGPAFWIFSAQT
jgi:hypothetical protein